MNASGQCHVGRTIDGPVFLADCLRFSFRRFRQWSFFMIPSTLIKFPVSDALKHPHSITLLSLFFNVGTMLCLSLLSPNEGNILATVFSDASIPDSSSLVLHCSGHIIKLTLLVLVCVTLTN